MCVTVKHCPAHCAANESSEGRMLVCAWLYVCRWVGECALISMKDPLIRPLWLLIVTFCVGERLGLSNNMAL